MILLKSLGGLTPKLKFTVKDSDEYKFFVNLLKLIEIRHKEKKFSKILSKPV